MSGLIGIGYRSEVGVITNRASLARKTIVYEDGIISAPLKIGSSNFNFSASGAFKHAFYQKIGGMVHVQYSGATGTAHGMSGSDMRLVAPFVPSSGNEMSVWARYYDGSSYVEGRAHGSSTDFYLASGSSGATLAYNGLHIFYCMFHYQAFSVTG